MRYQLHDDNKDFLCLDIAYCWFSTNNVPSAFLFDLLLKQIMATVMKIMIKMAPTTPPKITSNGRLSVKKT